MECGIKLRLDWIDGKSDIEKIRKAGIKNIELSYKGLGNKEINFLKEFKFNYSLHAPYEGLRLRLFPWPHYNKKHIKAIENSLEAAIRLKAPYLVVHGGGFIKGYIRFKNIIKKYYWLKKFLDLYIKNFGHIFKRAEDNGVKVVIENLYPCFLCGRVFDIKYIQKKLPFVGFCFDLGHAEIYNQTNDLMKLNIDYVHISDNNKKEDQHLRLGEGMIDFKSLLNELDKLNYKGKVIVENDNLADCILSFKKLKNEIKFN